MKTEGKFTTVEIGRMLGVNYTTVNNWIRAGKLRAFKTPGGHRRVEKVDLLSFLTQYRLPVPEGLSAAGKPCLLIVDDNQGFLRALKRWFSHYTNFEVLTADNSMEGLLLAAERKPAAILVDILMPGMDGVEVVKLLKSRPATHDLKVIAITAQADPQTRQEIVAAGALDCLDKTQPLTEIAELVAGHINQPGNRDQGMAGKDGEHEH